MFLSSSHCRVTHSAGSTVIRGKKTFHISVSPTALLRASQQGPTHLSFQPSSLLLSSYSSLCCCLALSHSDLMSGVVLNKSFFPMFLLPASTITTLDTHPHTHTPKDTDCTIYVRQIAARDVCTEDNKRYSRVGCWWLPGRFTPSLPDRLGFPTPTCILRAHKPHS